MFTERLNQKFYDINIFGYQLAVEAMVATIAIVALYYAIRSFKAAKRQNELSTVPHLFFETENGTTPNSSRLVLICGNDKLAYDFHIDDLYRFMESERWAEAKVSKYEFKFDATENIHRKKRTFLSTKDDKIPVRVFEDGQELEEDFATWLFSDHLRVTQFRVRFTDSQSFKYYTDIVFDQGGLSRIKRAPRRLTIIRNFFISVESAGYRLKIMHWRLKIAYHRLFSG